MEGLPSGEGRAEHILGSSELLCIHKLIFVTDSCWHSGIIMVTASEEQNLQLAATAASY